MTGCDVSGTTIRKEDLWTRDLGTKGVCMWTGTGSRCGLVPTAGRRHETVRKRRTARTSDATTGTVATDLIGKVSSSLCVVQVLSCQVPAGTVGLGRRHGIVRVSLVVTQINWSVGRAFLHTGHSAASTGLCQTLRVCSSPCRVSGCCAAVLTVGRIVVMVGVVVVMMMADAVCVIIVLLAIVLIVPPAGQ